MLLKLSRLAFDPAAQEGESQNAACMMVKVARKSGFSFDRVVELLGGGRGGAREQGPPPREEKKFTAGDTIMPFGKFKGRSFNAIFGTDPGYLKWMSRELEDRLLRKRAQDFLKEKGV